MEKYEENNGFEGLEGAFEQAYFLAHEVAPFRLIHSNNNNSSRLLLRLPTLR